MHRIGLFVCHGHDSSSQEEKRDVNIETALEANPMFAETCKPGMRALDDPAMSSEPLAAFHAATGRYEP
ncbi:hypothetical protein WS63_07200 [Burkholderia stagnalis]|nr:hypothetical protein WS63_07200 [Burkholderia stagnalis]KVO52843.1 hypothetical protein WT18_28175 [Burkholderia stagnalis]KVP06865.1 hypothetical protein WT20_25250 [Burkholderia stagnalis]KVW97711.1 hypothetical protein WT30_09245 [Burkholderia stagnalis]KWH83378.1 hypothetical protein WT66_07665 [Burkholderia stagnalis]